MMLAMFAGKNRDDWVDLLPAVMMAYRSSVHKSTGFSPYRLMFGEECTLPMDIGPAATVAGGPVKDEKGLRPTDGPSQRYMPQLKKRKVTSGAKLQN